MIKRPFRPNLPHFQPPEMTLLATLSGCDLYWRPTYGSWIYVVWSNRARINSFGLLGGTSAKRREYNFIKRKVSAGDFDRILAIAEMKGVEL